MNGLTSIHFAPAYSTDRSVTRLINRLGTTNFRDGLFDFFNEASAAEHCGVYMLSARKLEVCGAMSRDGSGKARSFVDRYVHKGHWISDPTM